MEFGFNVTQDPSFWSVILYLTQVFTNKPVGFQDLEVWLSIFGAAIKKKHQIGNPRVESTVIY